MKRYVAIAGAFLVLAGFSALGAPQTASATHCSVSARLSPDYVGNRYRIGGTIRCGGSGTRQLVCKAVHRHSTYWHSHSNAIVASREADFSQTSGWVGGTNDDTYKANCKGYYDGSYQRTSESPAYNL